MWKNNQENFGKRKMREDLPYYVAELDCKAPALEAVWSRHKNRQREFRRRSTCTGGETHRISGERMVRILNNIATTGYVFLKDQ